MFRSFFGSASTTIEDFDGLLRLAEKGTFQELLKTAQDNASGLKEQSDSLISTATATETAAQKVFEEETRVARQKLQASLDKVGTLRQKAAVAGKKAKDALNLISKFKK